MYSRYDLCKKKRIILSDLPTSCHFLYSPPRTDVEQNFMPWLMTEVSTRLDRVVAGRAVLDGILRAVVTQRREAFAKLEAAASSPPGTAQQTTKTPSPPPPPAEDPAPEPAAETTAETEVSRDWCVSGVKG